MPTEQGYRDYLAKPPHELTANTINSYCSGLNHLFNHAGIPPYSESDPNRLDEMLRRYGIGGAEAEIGAYGNGSARNALRHWADYVATKQASLVITLTEGGIDNGYVSIPREQTLFPDECIEYEQRPAQQLFKLQLPDGRVEQSKLLNKYSRIQARFNALFRQAELGAGDRVQLTRVEPYRYEMRFLKHTETAEQPKAVSFPVSTPRKDAAMSTPPLNQILFGPPGTGKTYNTINHALAILDPEFLTQHPDESDTARKALKARFDELVKAGRIDFVTFHQSFSYEDFVEGIRAENDEDGGQLKYEVVDGVFKRLCEVAAAKVTRGDGHNIMTLAGRRVWKMSLGNTKGGDAHIFDDCIEQGVIRLGYGGAHDYSQCKSREAVQAVLEKSVGKIDNSYDYTVTSVVTLVTRMKVGDLVVVTDGNLKFRAIGEITGNYRRELHPDYTDSYAQVRPIKWLSQYSHSLPSSELINGRFSQMTLYELKAPTLVPEKLLALLNASPTQVVKSNGNNKTSTLSGKRVLIIDEINRGNISRIFGELITLIEPSKRQGADEALEVILPYSKKPFCVPDNLYIIGTMNTADRSLAGLDIALRRRFAFVEMPPKPELLADTNIDGVNIGQLLEVMNQRIEVLLDRDHCLGHAYFMPLKQEQILDKLATIFKNQIIPLLQEYFFEDWERISWVLNGQQASNKDLCFIRKPEGDRRVSRLFGNELANQLQDRCWKLNPDAFINIDSYRQILKGSE